MEIQTRKAVSTIIIVSVFISVIVFLLAIFIKTRSARVDIKTVNPATIVKLQKFVSDEEFKEYISSSNTSPNLQRMDSFAGSTKAMAPEATLGTPNRVSDTNVQVKGIDEPDIVKTDGKNLFISNQNLIYPMYNKGVSIIENIRFMPVPPPVGETSVISIFPPQEMQKIGNVTETGDLLIDKNNLVVFGNNKITGFNITNPGTPQKSWTMDLEQNYIVTSRALNGKIYAVVRSNTTSGSPCPILFGSLNSTKILIPCREIYHPSIDMPVDSVYTVLAINPSDGSIFNKNTFVGSPGATNVYMSESAIYITYTYSEDFGKFYFDFLKSKAVDLVSTNVISKLEKLANYDISSQSKLTELQLILESYKNTLTQDERLRVENEIQNRMARYLKDRARELETTGIVKLSVSDLSLSANGAVPGHPLNQFSLDEYNGDLRIAVNISPQFYFGQSEPTNDLYILDKNLTLKGYLLDLGVGEQIFSTRFIEDKAYVVTFKQIDPFFVIDLSNPSNPRKSGELKIPGYSSYLDLIDKNLVLGVGQEGQSVKASLFDVSDANNPREVSKYTLDEYWTEVNQNHHAFLLDTKHKVFFLPGGKGGYVFSYSNATLKLVKAVNLISPKRAVYVNDYLYIVGEQEVKAFDENTWSEISNFDY